MQGLQREGRPGGTGGGGLALADHGASSGPLLALRLRDALFCTKFIAETRSWLRRGASAASSANSRAGWFATRAQAAPEEKKEEKTPPNKEDVDKILRDLKLKMPGFVTAGTAADAASAAERHGGLARFFAPAAAPRYVHR